MADIQDEEDPLEVMMMKMKMILMMMMDTTMTWSS
jgi:hypothetical protein